MHSASNNGNFPGVEAGREELMKFFNTVKGQDFLRNTAEYHAAFTLFQHNKGLLSRILHRLV
jgi:hypothetical protein